MLNQFGTYRAVVINNQDPLSQKRCLLQVPQVLGSTVSNWAQPNSYYPVPPVPGTQVWATFDGGDTRYPIYSSPTSQPYGTFNMQTNYTTFTGTQPGWSTSTLSGEFTTASYPWLTVPVPPSGHFQVGISLFGWSGKTTYGLWLGFNLYDATSGSFLYSSEYETMVRVVGVPGTQIQSYNAGPYFVSPTQYSAVVFRPTWNIGIYDSTSTPSVANSRFSVYPLPAYDLSQALFHS